jgi:hypothetical protein
MERASVESEWTGASRTFRAPSKEHQGIFVTLLV